MKTGIKDRKIGSLYKRFGLNTWRLWLLTLLLIGSFLTFNEPLNQWLLQFFGELLKSVPKNRYFNTSYSIGLIMLAVYYGQKLYKLRTSSDYWIFTLFILSTWYLTERTLLHNWRYESFIFRISYFDFVLILAVVEILIEVIKVMSLTEYENRSGILDIEQPITSIDEDEYGRNDLAEKLAAELDKFHADKSLTIGLNGVWGSGKSSFINLIDENLNRNKWSVIKFNPWRSDTPNNIYRDFFDILSSELARYDKNIKTTLNQYLSKISQVEGAFGTQFVRILRETVFSHNESLSDDYDKINHYLKRIDKQFIVFIDDLDRLDPQEIIYLFKLIRNTANFRNIVYIVAFDRAYILEALKGFSPYSPNDFIEKIFDAEIVLPSLPSSIMLNEFKNQLRNIDSSFNLSDDLASSNLIGKFFKNKRSINKYIRSLGFLDKELVKELNLDDFLLLSILNYKYPHVIEFLYHNRDRFFTDPQIKVVRTSLDQEVRNFRLQRRSKEKDGVRAISFIGFLKELELGNLQKFNLTLSDITLISSALFKLFSSEDNRDNISCSENSIIQIDWFDSYFTFTLNPNSQFPASKCKELMISGGAEFEKFIVIHLDTTALIQAVSFLDKNFKNLLNQYRNRETRIIEDSLEKLVVALIDRNPHIVPHRLVDDIFSLIYTDIESAKRRYSFHFSQPVLNRSFFNYQAIKGRLKGKNKDFLDVKSLVEINSQLSKNYLNNKPEVNNEFLGFLHNNLLSIDGETDEIQLDAETLTVFRDFLSEDDGRFHNFLNVVIGPYAIITGSNEADSFSFDAFIPQLFESWDEFEVKLLQMKNYEHFELVKELFKEFKESDFKKFRFQNNESIPSSFVNASNFEQTTEKLF